MIEKNNKKLSKRTKISAILILLFIPLTIYLGINYLGDRKYFFISTIILFETMIPFFMIFEEKVPQTRELILIAGISAIAVAGRMAFFWLPQFKPVLAIVIIAGISLGPESGFLCGALSMFASNIFFGQGPWTPWQMFAAGIIGFISGITFSKGKIVINKIILIVFSIICFVLSIYGVILLFNSANNNPWNSFFIVIFIFLLVYAYCKRMIKERTIILALFGFFITFFVYGGIMDPASVIMFSPTLNMKAILAAYISGLGFNFIHALASFAFLLALGEEFIEKIQRIKVKYGLID